MLFKILHEVNVVEKPVSRNILTQILDRSNEVQNTLWGIDMIYIEMIRFLDLYYCTT